jgi:hypothetical protein
MESQPKNEASNLEEEVDDTEIGDTNSDDVTEDDGTPVLDEKDLKKSPFC